MTLLGSFPAFLPSLGEASCWHHVTHPRGQSHWAAFTAPVGLKSGRCANGPFPSLAASSCGNPCARSRSSGGSRGVRRGLAGDCRVCASVQVTLLIAFICVRSSVRVSHSAYSYFEVVTICNLIMILVFYLVHLFRLYRLLTCISWPLSVRRGPAPLWAPGSQDGSWGPETQPQRSPSHLPLPHRPLLLRRLLLLQP